MAKIKNAIRKQFIAKAEIDGDARTIIAMITTEAIDRDKEVIIAKGIDFEQFLNNPVVLWAHDSRQPPIAKARWIKRKGKKIITELIFAETELAEEVFQLFKGGFLNAFSIGFIPTKMHKPTPDEIKKMPEWAEVWQVIDKAELLEFSAVPVPANPEALAIAVKNKEVNIDGLELELELEVDNEIDDVEVFLAKLNDKPVEKLTLEMIKNAVDSLRSRDISVSVETIPIEVSEIKAEAVGVKVSPFIDVQAVVNEEIKKRRGIVYD